MEALMRQLIHERRKKSQRHMTPAEAFERYFGPEHGVELPPRARYGYQPPAFESDHGAMNDSTAYLLDTNAVCEMMRLTRNESEYRNTGAA